MAVVSAAGAALALASCSPGASAQHHAFVARLGIEADDVVRSTAGTTSGVSATSDQGQWLWAATAVAGIDWAPLARLRVNACGGADVAFNRVDYVVAPRTASPIVSTDSVRGRVEFGLTVDVW